MTLKIRARLANNEVLIFTMHDMGLRPDHAGRLVRLEYRSEARCYVGELFAVHSDAEVRTVSERIETKGERWET